MPQKLMSVAVVCAIVVVSSRMLATPGQTQPFGTPQPGTQQPGQMTQARVFIENRGKPEAVPVDLRDVNIDRPLRVQIINADPDYGQTNPVNVRPIRSLWEYQTVVVAPGEDLALRLNTLGQSGWEAMAVVAQGQRTTIVLKRPR